MRIKDVDVVEAHSFKRLVTGGDQVFSTAKFTVRTRPHVIACFGRDDQFVAVTTEVSRQNLAKSFLGTAGGRAVVVGEIKMGDAMIKRRLAHRSFYIVRCVATKVMPKP